MSFETCPSCGADQAPDSRFCRSCGESLAEAVGTTAAATYVAAVPGPAVRRLISSDRVAVGGFAPGTTIAGRYRIIGLLGRGGMGEVYRADDLKLGQPIALKFLPPALADDPVRRERLLAEVRIARQVSHPNICRVYDIAEIEEGSGAARRTRYFLTMEYIDGEDLASLLQRIGYLSTEKALDITRQLVTGLAAAHERGVLHRDLKPANVMLDGRGRVRITDFGLAIAAGDAVPVDDGAGTPLYMAPEQLSGQPATVRSDVYALGMILYELYTGRRAFVAPTLGDLRALKESSIPTAPSEHRAGVDPIVERVIMRCLERDPRQRPGSVAQLAAALPGGDPLAALIAAGDTPSPEMVAAAGTKEGLKPAVAVACLAVVLLGGAVSAWMNPRVTLPAMVPAGKSPAVLVERAQEIIRKAGYPEAPGDTRWGFLIDDDFIRYADPSGAQWWRQLDRFNPILFWYRQSPAPLDPKGFRLFPGPAPSSFEWNDPPAELPGEVRVMLDATGRLRMFEAIPPASSAATRPPAVHDWSGILAEAPYEPALFVPSEPRWNPPAFADSRAAWELKRPDGTVRFEVAVLDERLVSVRVIEPWTRGPVLVNPFAVVPRQALVVAGALVTVVVGATIFFARRNWRLGRGDRRGAARITTAVLGASLVSTIAGVHATGLLDLTAWWKAGQLMVSFAAFVALMYLALEPFIRRYWPHLLVTWTRALTGEFTDPQVARDVLIGCSTGITAHALGGLSVIGPTWLGQPAGLPQTPVLNMTTPLTFIGQMAQNTFVAALFIPLLYLFVLFLSRLAVRKEIPALLVASVIMTAVSMSGPISAVFAVLVNLLLLTVLMRFGLLALVVAGFVLQSSIDFPLIADTSRWWAGYGYAAFAIILAIALYGFRTSLAGRPVFEIAD